MLPSDHASVPRTTRKSNNTPCFVNAPLDKSGGSRQCNRKLENTRSAITNITPFCTEREAAHKIKKLEELNTIIAELMLLSPPSSAPNVTLSQEQ